MSKKEKLLKRLLNNPKDFTFNELSTLLGYFDYREIPSGKTSGSRVTFSDNEEKDYIRIHKPHPRNILKPYQIKDIIDKLKERELL